MEVEHAHVVEGHHSGLFLLTRQSYYLVSCGPLCHKPSPLTRICTWSVASSQHPHTHVSLQTKKMFQPSDQVA